MRCLDYLMPNVVLLEITKEDEIQDPGTAGTADKCSSSNWRILRNYAIINSETASADTEAVFYEKGFRFERKT